MLGKILEAMGGTAPSFASFVKGGPAQRQFPGGFAPDIAALLQAMNQPGAFTSTRTGQFTGPTPSGISDVTQIASLAYLLSQLGLGNLLAPIGGALGIGGVNPALGDTTPTPDFLSSLPSGDIPGVNFTPDPSQGMTMDPNAGLPPDMTWLTSY